MIKTILLKTFYFVARALNLLGLDLKRLTPSSNLEYQVTKGLQEHVIDFVIDVGANKGQYATALRQFGYQGKIISIEPLSDAHQQLVRHARSDPKWLVAPRCAAGASNGNSEIFISGNSVSSSILQMAARHIKAAKKSAPIGSEEIAITRLDDLLLGFLEGDERVFLKIDTQGFEWSVLDGAPELLENVIGIQIEASIVELYSGQHLFDEIYERLSQLGFSLWGIQNGFTDKVSGETLQFDMIMFKGPH